MANSWIVEYVEEDGLGDVATAGEGILQDDYTLSALGHVQISEMRGSSKHYSLYLLFFGEEGEL